MGLNFKKGDKFEIDTKVSVAKVETVSFE